MNSIKDLVFKVIEQDENSEISKIKALTILHGIQKDLDQLSKSIKEWKSENINEFETAAMEYPDGYGGYTFEFRNGGKMYNFKNIEEWTKKSEELKNLEGKYKAALNLKLKGVEPIDSETGEIVPIPIITYRASSVVLKAKKS